ncbi:aminoglycoside N(3)-acetyltransferase [Deinococcus peraridilitoris]|uniref:Aminoglycoside N(3)-acetyltransferase n=1 Tax=Deinococcus peraridilitoris (strain DSM 19664 / LMG 22246 / CIP 109416 / KR-200) TaxID=937777 RepID=L0A0S6_DEIPD|nr:AAC(3) family N-acetyltransferase [Deinococcus peraridilitoris]AFZ66777.1 aminoglycoside N3'-acetyltransferase [Deinococcus peraridilitoris DSM 19664]
MKTLVTHNKLVADLKALGLQADSIVMVHCKLSALGWVLGGEQTVNDALREVVGPNGTLVMPTQSWQLCDPAYLNDPSVPRECWDDVRASLPVYHPACTPTRTMGAVAELFRTLPGTLRSNHPHRSIAAQGPVAFQVVAQHELTNPCGEATPLGVLYELDAAVLLLGVSYDKCTALHLAEDRADSPGKHLVRNGAALMVDGRREWVEWREPWPSDEDFEAVGAAFAATGQERRGSVGLAESRLFSFRALVDFATNWFPHYRDEATFSQDTAASG